MRRSRAAPVLMAVVAVLAWAETGSASPSTSSPRPHVRVVLSVDLQFSNNAATCASLAHCYLAGSTGANPSPAVSYSSDAGRAWTTVAFEGAESGSFSSIACTSSDLCTATGQRDIATLKDRNEGQTRSTPIVDVGRARRWRSLALPAGATWLGVAAASCSSWSSCLMDLGGSWVATSDAGRSWHVVAVDSPVVPAMLTCERPRDCIEGGVPSALAYSNASRTYSLWRTRNEGRTWQAVAVPAGFDRFPASGQVSQTFAGSWCSGSTCEVYSNWTNYNEVDRGATWVSFDDARHWTSMPFGSFTNAASIWCPTAQRCLGTGPVFTSSWGAGNDPAPVYSTDGGRRWQISAMDVAATPQSVACTATTCVMTNEQSAGVLVSHDDGATWVTAPGPTSGQVQYFAACATAQRCFVLSEGPRRGLLYASDDAGATWRVALVLPESLQIALACDGHTCWADVGYHEWTTTNSGTTWTRHRIAPVPLQVGESGGTAISCARSTCVRLVASVHNVLDVSRDRGATYRAVAIGVPSNELVSVNCVTAATCYVVGGSYNSGRTIVARTVDAGATWTVLPQLAKEGVVTEIGCSARKVCLVATQPPGASGYTGGQDVQWTADGGRHWTLLVRQLTARAPVAIACESDRVCVVTSQGTNYTAELLRVTLPAR